MCIFVHITAFTQSCNNEFDIFDAVNFASNAFIIQNVLLNLVPFNMTFEKSEKDVQL